MLTRFATYILYLFIICVDQNKCVHLFIRWSVCVHVSLSLLFHVFYRWIFRIPYPSNHTMMAFYSLFFFDGVLTFGRRHRHRRGHNFVFNVAHTFWYYTWSRRCDVYRLYCMLLNEGWYELYMAFSYPMFLTSIMNDVRCKNKQTKIITHVEIVKYFMWIHRRRLGKFIYWFLLTSCSVCVCFNLNKGK